MRGHALTHPVVLYLVGFVVGIFAGAALFGALGIVVGGISLSMIGFALGAYCWRPQADTPVDS